MNVLLISANTERINLATLPYGLALVAAAVRAAGHQTAMLDLLREADPTVAIARDIQALRPDAIGISVWTAPSTVRSITPWSCAARS